MSSSALATELVHMYMFAYICNSHINDFHIFRVIYSPLGGLFRTKIMTSCLLAQFVDRFSGIAEVMG